LFVSSLVGFGCCLLIWLQIGGSKAYTYFFILYTQESKAKIDTL
jgi:hypothetical protein